MNFDPYAGREDPSQRSWGQAGNPGNPNGQGYNATARLPNIPSVVPVTQAAVPPWSHANTIAQPPSFLLALLSFPLIVLASYAWPAPTSFARHKSHANRGVLVILLALLAVITGTLAYAWGRVPTLSQGIQSLSLNRVVPHQLSMALVDIIALVTPLLALAFAGMLHYIAHTQQGQGTYRAQLYSVLVIETPLALAFLIAAILLSIAPALGTLARIPFLVASIMLFLYSLLLFVPSLMAVQGLRFEKALFCLVSVLVIVLLLVALVSMLFEGWDTSSNQHGTGDRHFKRARNRRERICPRCGFSLEVYDQLHKTLTQSCPRCGGPLA